MRQILLLLLFLAPIALHAQPDNEDIESAAGTTYVIAYPDTTMNTFDARYPNTRHPDKAYMYIYSAVDNRVQIRGAGFNKTELLQAGRFAIVDLMDPSARAPKPIVTESNVVTQATFRLEADQPILVYCYLLTRFGTEAWTPLPVEAWGREELGLAVVGVEADVPGGGVDQRVVGAAEQHQVVECGVAAVGPVLDVVGVAGDGGSGAAGEGAVLVAGDQGVPEGSGDESAGAAEVEELGLGAEHDGQDVGVAGQGADRGRGQPWAGVQHSVADTVTGTGAGTVGVSGREAG